MKIAANILVADASGRTGDQVAVPRHGSRPFYLRTKKKTPGRCPARCAHSAFKAADSEYKTFVQSTRNLWAKNVRRPHMSGYDLWMQVALHDLLKGADFPAGPGDNFGWHPGLPANDGHPAPDETLLCHFNGVAATKADLPGDYVRVQPVLHTDAIAPVKHTSYWHSVGVVDTLDYHVWYGGYSFYYHDHLPPFDVEKKWANYFILRVLSLARTVAHFIMPFDYTWNRPGDPCIWTYLDPLHDYDPGLAPSRKSPS